MPSGLMFPVAVSLGFTGVVLKLCKRAILVEESAQAECCKIVPALLKT